MARMHVDELEIDEMLVRRLLAGQFPEWSDLPLSRVEPVGTVNAIFRLGDELSLRLAYTWADGKSAPVEEIDSIQAARDLAGLVTALRQVDDLGWTLRYPSRRRGFVASYGTRQPGSRRPRRPPRPAAAAPHDGRRAGLGRAAHMSSR
jgi:hypothetical protein